MMKHRPEVLPDDDLAMRPFTASLPMALLQAREATMRLFRPLLADHELTEQQWRVLRALAAAGEPLAAGDVADRTFLLGPSISRILGNLTRRGLVNRTVAVNDLRRADIVLSDAGRALVQRIAPKSEATYNTIEAKFGADRLQHLMSELLDFFISTTESAPTPGDLVQESNSGRQRA